MQVRYQAAPRPDRMRMIAQTGSENSSDSRLCRPSLAAKNLDELFEFEPHLMDELLALIEVDLRIAAGEAVPCAADSKALLIQEAANLPNDQHVLALIVPAVTAALDRLQLREFLLPIAQHMGFDAAQVADFADGEVALPRDRRQFAIVAWFQHTPRRGPSVSGPDGM
jgi:hypothetical protein